MSISTFNLFSIGIGPSSSHTVGPMRAARKFLLQATESHFVGATQRVLIDLYGSLALTGKGHATDLAVILGLMGHSPEEVDPDAVKEMIAKVRRERKLSLLGGPTIQFKEEQDLLFHRDKQLPYHPNGMRFTFFGENGKELFSKVYYSVGGGFIVEHEHVHQGESVLPHEQKAPYPFKTAQELLSHCKANGFRIDELMMENEKSMRTEDEVRKGILNIWKVMCGCIARGVSQEGILPGGLGVRRRARSLYEHLHSPEVKQRKNPAEVMEWVSLWALAVNEENAAGGRVVTAPTNGAAGVIPAVLTYYHELIEGANEEGIIRFFLTAAAIGILYKEGASISAAEMGCMGEVGVACSMAAAGLTSALNGTNEQIENAAEIGMEHNLGLTCDPIMGLVQIPCIERNTMGAVKAINASMLALRGDGIHRVSLDQVIATMRATGNDMKAIYKETSQGGLAVNVPEC